MQPGLVCELSGRRVCCVCVLLGIHCSARTALLHSSEPERAAGSVPAFYGSYLVDPASSHMLVSKIKPCMSKYKLLIL